MGSALLTTAPRDQGLETGMKAFFTTTRNVIEQAIESESRHHESGLNVDLSQTGEYVVIEGTTQTIMFLIGEIAGYGEDGLVKIES